MPGIWEPSGIEPKNVAKGQPKFICAQETPSVDPRTGFNYRCGAELPAGAACSHLHVRRPTSFSTRVVFGAHLNL